MLQTLAGKEKLAYNLVDTRILEFDAGSSILEVLWDQDSVCDLKMQSSNSESPA